MKKSTKILNSSFLILNFLFTSCYTWWESSIPMDTVSKTASLTDLVQETKTITSLDCPTQVMASQGLYSGSVMVAWNDSENASSYRIERAVVQPDSNGNYKEPEEADFSVIKKYWYSTNYEDTILSSPSTNNSEYNYKYYYRVCAENISKGYESSDYTDITQSKTAACGWLLNVPKKMEAGKGKSPTEIPLSWTAVPNARYYEIYRSEKQKTGFEIIDTIRANSTSYNNEVSESEQGTEFYFKVRAVLSSGETSAFSDTALGYSLVSGAPTPPDTVQVTDGYGTSTSAITVSWSAYSGAVDASKTLTYALYRTSSTDSVYTLIGKYDSSKLSVNDNTSLKPGVYYYYYVQTIVTDNTTGEVVKSAFSASGNDSEKPAMGFLLSAPDSYEISDTHSDGTAPADDCLVLRWTPAIGSELEGVTYTYNIYKSDTQNGSYDILKTNVSPEETDSTGYYEYEIEKCNFYKISTNNGSLESAKSGAMAPSPDAPTGVKASKTEQFGFDETSYNTNEVYPVKITWKKPAAGDAYGYNVYRSTKPDSSFRCLNEEPVTEAANGTFTYIDQNETARAGTVYYYKVVSVNVLGQGKKSNDPTTDTALNCVGYGAITRDQWFREYNKSIMKSQSKLTLMHKANDMDKLGSETINGDLSGTLSYKAAIAGLGAEITMHYADYCDFAAPLTGLGDNGKYFILTGNTDTTSNMSANGNMHETVTCTGMYPGYAVYDGLEIKGGAAGGGYYMVQTTDLNGTIILSEDKVDWTVGEER